MNLIRDVLGPFLFSRLAIFALFLVPSFVRVIPADSTGVGAFTVVRAPLVSSLRHSVQGGDSYYYVEIASEGYHGELTRAYPPGYPLALAAAARMTGEYWLTGSALNSLLMLGGLVALYKVVLTLGLSLDDARRAVVLCCIFPGTHFMSVPLGESMLFLTSTWAICFGCRQQWWYAGLCGVVASVSKVPGSLVVIPLVILYFQKYQWSIRKELIPILLVPSGMAGYLAYLYRRGEMDFHAVQRASGHAGMGSFLTPIFQYLRHPGVFSSWNVYPLHIAAMTLMFASGFYLIRKGYYAHGCYALACILLPLTVTQTLASLTRYSLPCCSLYVALALLGRAKGLYAGYYAICIVVSAGLALLYGLRFGVAMA